VWFSFGSQTTLGCGSFLKRMQETGFTSRRKRAITFVANRVLSLVNTDDGDTDWMPAAAAKLDYLVSQIIDHAIDLLNHGLREYLHFDANLNRGDWSSSDFVTSIEDRSFTGNNLAKCCITAASRDASASILNI